MNFVEEMLEANKPIPKREPVPRNPKEKFWLSENGSLLPNKFACWDYPFDQVSRADE